MKIKLITISAISLIGLSGCFNGSDNPVYESRDNVETFSEQNPSSESVTVLDATMLKSDLDALFGSADSEPKAVEDGDTVQDVMYR